MGSGDPFPKRMRLWERRLIQHWAIWQMIASLLLNPKRHAAIVQLMADERQLEMELLMGRVSSEQLQQRMQALTERADALKKGGGDGQQR